MDPTFNSLVVLLEGQKVIYSDLLSLGKTKQTDLIKGSIEELDAVTRREENLIFQAGRLEEERYRCVSRLMEANGRSQDVPLREIIDMAPQEIKEKLEELHLDMVKILAELDMLNQENMKLIQQSLKLIQVTIEALNPAARTTYTPDHDVKVEAFSRLLDRKV